MRRFFEEKKKIFSHNEKKSFNKTTITHHYNTRKSNNNVAASSIWVGLNSYKIPKSKVSSFFQINLFNPSHFQIHHLICDHFLILDPSRNLLEDGWWWVFVSRRQANNGVYFCWNYSWSHTRYSQTVFAGKDSFFYGQVVDLMMFCKVDLSCCLKILMGLDVNVWLDEVHFG